MFATTRVLLDLQNQRYLADHPPAVPPHLSLLAAAEALAAMFRGVVRLEVPRDFWPEELRVLETIGTFGRSMRADAPVILHLPQVADCDDAA